MPGFKEGIGLAGKWVWPKGQQGGSLWDGNVHYLDCIHVNILIVMSSYSFARCSHWGVLGKGHMGSLHCFLKTACEPQLPENEKFNFKEDLLSWHPPLRPAPLVQEG